MTTLHRVPTPVDDGSERGEPDSTVSNTEQMEILGQLAGGVAHDFNNLLTLISGYTELLIRHLAGDARASSLIKEIRVATMRASMLTGQLLTVTSYQPVRPVMLAPVDVVRSLIEVLERVIPPEIEVSWALDDEAGRVRIDRGQLEQLVLNLAFNARDAMPLGGSLHISVTRGALVAMTPEGARRSTGSYLRIAVSDNGSGMSPETQRRCFEPLYTTKGSAGTGLGLPAVRRVVTEAGGGIRFDSQLGWGSTFEVFLPTIQEHEDVLATLDPGAVSAEGSETVLLAEDDASVRQLVRRALVQAGYRVLEASSGYEALAAGVRHHGTIDLLISDVVMAGVSGRAVAMRLRNDRPSLAVLLISGSNDADVLLGSGLQPGTAAFLAKPFNLSELLSTARRLLDARRLKSTGGSSSPGWTLYDGGDNPRLAGPDGPSTNGARAVPLPVSEGDDHSDQIGMGREDPKQST